MCFLTCSHVFSNESKNTKMLCPLITMDFSLATRFNTVIKFFFCLSLLILLLLLLVLLLLSLLRGSESVGNRIHFN